MAHRSSISLAAVAAAAAAAVLSVPGGAVAKSTGTTLSLTAPSSIAAGGRITFSGSSFYASGPQRQLTVFAVHRSHCGRTARAPHSAKVLLSEMVDNYSAVGSFSSPLSRRGQWVLCGYMTSNGNLEAHASAKFKVL